MNDNEVSGVSRRNMLRGTALGVFGAAALPVAWRHRSGGDSVVMPRDCWGGARGGVGGGVGGGREPSRVWRWAWCFSCGFAHGLMASLVAQFGGARRSALAVGGYREQDRASVRVTAHAFGLAGCRPRLVGA